MAHELSSLQKAELAIYKQIKDVCDRHGLRYFASGGTAIGATLNGGFIPWDDDIDLMMPRPDYVRFAQFAGQEFPSWLKIFDGFRAPKYDCHIVKVHDTRTTFTDKMHLDQPSSYTGVFVDIAIIDGAPSDGALRAEFELVVGRNNIKHYLRRISRERNPPQVDEFVQMLWPTPGMQRKLRLALVKLLPENYYIDKNLRLVAQYPYDGSDYLVTLDRWFDIAKYGLRKSQFASAKTFPFEDTTIPVPIGNDEIMLNQYGKRPTLDRSKLTEDETTAHHETHALVDTTKPFEEYIELRARDRALSADEYAAKMSLGAQRRLLIFAHYNANGVVDEYVSYMLAKIAGIYSTVLFVSNSEIDASHMAELTKRVDRVIIRPNSSYDFGAWRDGLSEVGWGDGYDNVTLLNSSVFGPVAPLLPLYERMSGTDFWGMTNYPPQDGVGWYPGGHIAAHVQSYFMSFNRSVLASAVFREFFSNIPDGLTRDEVVWTLETRLTEILHGAGFEYATVVDANCEVFDNPDLSRYQPGLCLDRGVAFIKIKALSTSYCNDVQGLVGRLSRHYPRKLLRKLL